MIYTYKFITIFLFQMIKFFFILWFPTITRFLKFKFFDKEVEDFFFSITKDSFEIRRKSGIKRNDFIQLLLELKEMGTVQVDAKDLEQDERECLESLQSQEPMTKLGLLYPDLRLFTNNTHFLTESM